MTGPDDTGNGPGGFAGARTPARDPARDSVRDLLIVLTSDPMAQRLAALGDRGTRARAETSAIRNEPEVTPRAPTRSRVTASTASTGGVLSRVQDPAEGLLGAGRPVSRRLARRGAGNGAGAQYPYP